MMFLNCSFETGDLIFFGKNESESEFEQAVLDVASESFYHVALIKGQSSVIHAFGEHGVVEMNIIEAIEALKPDFFEVCRVNVPRSQKKCAALFSESVVGSPYNDLFSEDTINSKGEVSFYCSQLITEAYRGSDMTFPKHVMKFSDADGSVLQYWKEYYAARGKSVPSGEEGSHPSQIRRSPQLNSILIRK